ncbi:hypothetical protein STEG23_006156, partial [Scotinomys teguina]
FPIQRFAIIASEVPNFGTCAVRFHKLIHISYALCENGVKLHFQLPKTQVKPKEKHLIPIKLKCDIYIINIDR